MDSLHVIVDLQYGSCGKGLFAGYLAKRILPDTIVTAWAPNSGHTFIDKEGNKMVHCMVPNGVVARSVRRVLLGPGSVIDPALLQTEMDKLRETGHTHFSLSIHENAAVVQERHRSLEQQTMFRIGSTMKGVGAAIVEKIGRSTNDQITAGTLLLGTPLEDSLVSARGYNQMIDEAMTVMVEGSQGFSLSLNHGFYPYTTSRDCTTMQVLSDCGIPYLGGPLPYYTTRIYGVCRAYPIRVANRYETGPDGGRRQIGWSGPCYDDQVELEWRDVGVEPELTTVTKLPRRIFSFSKQQVTDAIRVNGVNVVFLNFANYVTDRAGLESIVRDIEDAGARVQWIGKGPREDQIIDIDTHQKGAAA
jgi:adenylosuccinate synthase